MFLDGIILGVVLAYIRGGSFKGFQELEIRGGKVILILFAVQLLLILLTFQTLYPVEFLANTMRYWANLFTLVFLYFAWMNRNLPGFSLIMLGILLNLAVILANGGKMPVSIEAANMVDPNLVELLKTQGYKHAIMTEETNLWFLADIIPLVPPYPNHKVISIGDVFLNVGGFIFVWKTMFMVKRRKNEEALGGEVA